MQSSEKYCAERLRLSEGEQFFAVGDGHLSRFLSVEAVSLPDLLSFKKVESSTYFRIREVKYKLEERLVTKAVTQLRSGLRWVNQKFDCPSVDRLELVVALKQRELKAAERRFLGAELGCDRYELHLAGRKQIVTDGERVHEVSVLLV